MRRRRASVPARVALLAAGAAGLLGAAACSNSHDAKQAADVRTEVVRVQRANALLQRQIELAAGKDFYLVIDPAASEMTLMLRGAELQRYAVRGLQVGSPRVAWIGRRDPRPWQGTIWTSGELDPPRQIDRLVIQAAPPGKDTAEPEAPPIPPTPEELYPVPPRFHIRFDDGRSLEIRPREADEKAGRVARVWASWSAKWHDVAAAAFGKDRDTVRLRLAMNPHDAESLYRSLPPAVRLIVLAGGGDAPSNTASPAKTSSTKR